MYDSIVCFCFRYVEFNNLRKLRVSILYLYVCVRLFIPKFKIKNCTNLNHIKHEILVFCWLQNFNLILSNLLTKEKIAL